jgi:hypothetical protein
VGEPHPIAFQFIEGSNSNSGHFANGINGVWGVARGTPAAPSALMLDLPSQHSQGAVTHAKHVDKLPVAGRSVERRHGAADAQVQSGTVSGTISISKAPCCRASP